MERRTIARYETIRLVGFAEDLPVLVESIKERRLCATFEFARDFHQLRKDNIVFWLTQTEIQWLNEPRIAQKIKEFLR